MSRSTGLWSGVVGGEVARRPAESLVERDGRGQGQELGGQPAAQGVQLAGAVGFEAEHVFGREVAAGVALVADDGQRAVAGDAAEHVQADVTFGGLWAGERQGAWRRRPART